MLSSLQRCRALRSVLFFVTEGACAELAPTPLAWAAAAGGHAPAGCARRLVSNQASGAHSPADSRLSMPVASLMALLPRQCPQVALDVAEIKEGVPGGMPEEELEALLARANE